MSETDLNKNIRRLVEGTPAPKFCLSDTNDTDVCLKDILGKKTILLAFLRGFA